MPRRSRSGKSKWPGLYGTPRGTSHGSSQRQPSCPLLLLLSW
jgi:hypothetical protein